VALNQCTVSRMLWTQHASFTTVSSLGGTYNGFRYLLAKVNGILIHQDLGNPWLFNQYGDLPPLQEGQWPPRASTYVLWSHDLEMGCNMQYHHRSRQWVYQSILGQSLLPPHYQSPALECLPPADGPSNQTAAPNDGAVPQNLFQLRPGQLGQIITTGRVCLQHLHLQFNSDDTNLGELKLPSYNTVYASQTHQFQIAGTGRLLDGRLGRDLPNSPWKDNWGSIATDKVRWQERYDFCCWTQSMVIDLKLQNTQVFKEARLLVQWTIYGK